MINIPNNENLQKNQEDNTGISRGELLYLLFLSFVMFLFVSIMVYMAIIVAPKILNTELGSLPVNANDVYPIMLQSILTVDSIVVGLFSFVLNRVILGSVNLVKRLKFDLFTKWIIFIIGSVVMIFLYVSLLLSIFYSINGMFYYGQLKTYITETKAIQIPNLFRQGLPITIMNSSYFNNTAYKNYTSLLNLNQTYNHLLSNARNSVIFSFSGLAIVLISALFYILNSFGVFDLINDIWNKAGIWSKIGLTAVFMSLLCPILYFINPISFKYYLIMSLIVFATLIIIAILVTIRTNKKNKKN